MKKTEPTAVRVAASVAVTALLMFCAVLPAAGNASGGSKVAPGETGYFVSHWTTADGLPGTVITSLAQTPDGYLWCGCPEGLCRFDGKRFRVFYPTEFPALKGISVMEMRVDGAGRLWISGTGGELVVLEGSQFRRLGEPEGVPAGQVGKFGVSKDGSFWFKGVSDNRFYHYVNGRFEAVVYPGIPASSIDRFYADRQGVRWGVDERKRVMVRFTSAGPEFQPLVAPAGTSSVWAGRFFWLQDGRLAVTSSHGIYALQDGRWKLRQAFGQPIAARGILNGIGDDQGHFWISLYNVGLVRSDPDQRTTRVSLPDSNARPFDRALLLDTQGNIWVASESGLYRVRRTTFLPQPEAPKRFQKEAVGSFVEDQAGTLWILYDFGWVRKTGGGWEYANSGHPEAPLEAGAAARDESVILAYSAPWNPRHFRLQQLNQEMAFVEKRYPDGTVKPLGKLQGIPRVVLDSRTNGLWLGTGEGLWLWKNGGFTRIHLPHAPAPCYVRGLSEDHEGRILVAVRDEGLYRRETDSSWRLLAGPDDQGAAGVAGIYVDARDTVWVATDSGLARWRDNEWHAFTDVRSELPREARTVISDEAGNLWITSPFGVVRVAVARLNARAAGRNVLLESTWFGRNDGLPSANCTDRQGALCRTPDGRIWVGTAQGAAVVDPNRLQQLIQKQGPPPVYIKTVLGDDRMLMDFTNSSELTRGGELLVAPGTHRVEFRYTAINLSGSGRNRFRYRLEGLEDQWVDGGAQRTVVYHNLAPRHYRFEVTAANLYGVRNEQGASLAFFVQPFWWQTIWFRIVVGIVILGLLGLVCRLRLNQLRRKQARQQEFARRLIESQETERKRIAAELHDSLGQNLLIAKNQLSLARESVTDVRTQGKLQQVGENVDAALHEARTISRQLRPFQLERLGLTTALRSMIRQTSESTKIPINAQIDSVDALLPADAEVMVYRILQEALSNVVKHADASAMQIRIGRNGRFLRMVVQDDGRGFDAESMLSGESRARGLGLTGFEERTRLLRGHFHCRSSPGQGTTLTFEVPVPESGPNEAKD